MSLPLTQKVQGFLSEVKSAAHSLALELEKLEQEVIQQRTQYETVKNEPTAPKETFIQELEAEFEKLKKQASLPAATKIGAAPNILQEQALLSLNGAEATSPPEVIALVEARNKQTAETISQPSGVAPVSIPSGVNNE